MQWRPFLLTGTPSTRGSEDTQICTPILMPVRSGWRGGTTHVIDLRPMLGVQGEDAHAAGRMRRVGGHDQTEVLGST